MKQTAVEFLEEQLNKIKNSSTNMNTWVSFLEKDFKELFTQAKEMERQQIIDARVNGVAEGIDIGGNPIT